MYDKYVYIHVKDIDMQTERATKIPTVHGHYMLEN